MKQTVIKTSAENVHIDCPNCDNWEQIGIDEPRHRLQSITLVEWMPSTSRKVEVSINHCTVCNKQFSLLWDYKN
jgi:hypothetical protein